MTQNRKPPAILAADVAGYSKLGGADEERTFARPYALLSDLIDPTIALHYGVSSRGREMECLSSSEAASTLCAALSKCNSVRPPLRQAWELDDADKAEQLLRYLARRPFARGTCRRN